MSQDNNHDEWLSLIEISGPFLAVPVLKKAFPQGLEAVDGRVRKYLRQAYEEWCEARDTDDPQFEKLHRAWIEEVLARGLEYDEKDSGELLKRGSAIPAALHITLPEHGVTLSPDYALVNAQKALLLIQTYPANTDLDATISQQGWVATPAERMVQLCRTTGCRLGLITNGERWLLIDAPVGSVVTYAGWYARLWGQEPLTLQAFLTLLGIRRFFVDASEQLPALFDESLQHQEEVTDALGEQVRRAVEVLIQSLDKEDLNSSRTLLQDVAPTDLYEAGLTIMMRLVFLLSAEERGLLLMGDEAYEANYAISTLRMQLRKESDEVLECRHDAWARLLATFRAVYGGIEHEILRLPALGGSLFDPDRFPFLEGRLTGSSWRTDDARPLPIDNRTVRLLLEAIQQYQGRTLSYRALDVEQIGYVYEGLLERTVKRTDAVTVELVGGKGAKKTIHTLSELEALRGSGNDRFTRHLASSDVLKRSEGAIRKDLACVVDAALTNHLLTACHGDEALRDRLLPIANLLQTDPWGYPLVYTKGAFIVTTGSDRRETGTHYTPKSLTESIVAETLSPVVYVGPAEGAPREQWTLKSPSDLLELKICDPAMGSGAFLVQACRWLSDRLVEAWSQAETLGKTVSVDGVLLEAGSVKELLPRDSEARMVIARSLIAERCLYGVDLNPLAVELAKLSIWLVTLAKGRPFGFLDHNLRCGDSLLGIHRLEQLTELNLTPSGKGQQRLFGKNIESAVLEAIELRQRLREMPIRDIHDVEAMARLDADARSRLEVPTHIADALVGEVFASGTNVSALESGLASLSIEAGQAVDKVLGSLESIIKRARNSFSDDLAANRSNKKPFHWPLEFPEVFSNEAKGFHSVIGNPPFVGGQLISGAFGERYAIYLANNLTIGKSASVDLLVYFFLRSFILLRKECQFGLLGRRSLSEGKNRESGLDELIRHHGLIYCANTDLPWPGKASVVVHQVHVRKGAWLGGRYLNGKGVETISAYLTSRDNGPITKLKENLGRAFQGAILLGEGFKVEEDVASKWIDHNSAYSKILRPFIGGSEINRDPECKPMCWVINFWDWPESECIGFEEAYRQVREKVLPERLSQKGERAKEKWWIYERSRWDLFSSIGRGSEYIQQPKTADEGVRTMERVICISTGVTKYPAFTFVSAEYIFSNKLCVIADDRYSTFAVLSSDVHSSWAWGQKTSMGGDLHSIVYAHGNIFETFPFPEDFYKSNDFISLFDIGQVLYEKRQAYMLSSNKGLTGFYNDFHDEKVSGSELVEIRNIQSKLNVEVARVYGWQDLDLSCDFYEVGYLPGGKNIRFTFSEEARLEVLNRLSRINRQRASEEVGVVKTSRKEIGLKSKASKNKAAGYTEQSGFDFG